MITDGRRQNNRNGCRMSSNGWRISDGIRFNQEGQWEEGVLEMECTMMRSGECPQVIAGRQPTLIVFDLDGTISDSRELGRETYKRVFELMGFGRISDELADSFNGPDADEVCRVMGIGADRRAEYDELIDQVEGELTHTLGRMFPGTERMLDALCPHATLAILTNGTQSYCEACMDAFGISSCIALHSGFVSGVSKAERILQWKKELGAVRVICIGDRMTDIQNARKANAYAIGVTYGMGSREELTGADALCDSPEEVAQVCLKWIGR